MEILPTINWFLKIGTRLVLKFKHLMNIQRKKFSTVETDSRGKYCPLILVHLGPFWLYETFRHVPSETVPSMTSSTCKINSLYLIYTELVLMIYTFWCCSFRYRIEKKDPHVLFHLFHFLLHWFWLG